MKLDRRPRLIILQLMLLGLVVGNVAVAQDTPRLIAGEAVGFGNNGFHLYSTDLSVGYFSSALPGATSVGGGLGGDFQGWLSLSTGYSYSGAKGTFSLTYTPEYTRRVRYSSLDSMNQSLRINGSRTLGARWAAHFSANGANRTAASFLFGSSALGSVVSAPDAVTSIGGGFSGAGAGSLAASQLFVFGYRVLSFESTAGLIYRLTPRLRMTLDAGASLYQSRPDNTVGFAPIDRRAETGVGSISLGYSLSPRTEVGTHFDVVDTRSAITDFQAASAVAYVDHKIGTHWVTSIAAGPAAIKPKGVSTILGTTDDGTAIVSRATKISYRVLATLAYRIRQNTLAGTYQRTVGDAYGFGAGENQSFDGAWDQRLLSSGWMIRAGGGQQRFTGGGFGALNTSYARASIRKALNRQLSFGMEYSFSKYDGALFRSLDVHTARMTLSWTPLLRDAPLLGRSKAPAPNTAPAGAFGVANQN